MDRFYTGKDDMNGIKIYGGDKVKYTYYRYGKVSYTSIRYVKFGIDAFEGKKGWILGGVLLDQFGEDRNKKELETLEVVGD